MIHLAPAKAKHFLRSRTGRGLADVFEKARQQCDEQQHTMTPVSEWAEQGGTSRRYRGYCSKCGKSVYVHVSAEQTLVFGNALDPQPCPGAASHAAWARSLPMRRMR